MGIYTMIDSKLSFHIKTTLSNKKWENKYPG